PFAAAAPAWSGFRSWAARWNGPQAATVRAISAPPAARSSSAPPASAISMDWIRRTLAGNTGEERTPPPLRPQRIEHRLGVGRRRRRKRQAGVGAGVLEGEEVGVEGLSVQLPDGRAEGSGEVGIGGVGGAIGGVADDRVADVGAVDADLVGAAGL